MKRNPNRERPSPKQGPPPLLGPDLVGGVLEKLCLSADAPTVERLCDFGTELLSWSRRVDLCGARTAQDFASGPLFDALTLVPLLEGSGSLLDVGSGGGLPGLPALILRPALQLTVLEPRVRRAAFLRHIRSRLTLPCEVQEGRLEDLSSRVYDGAVAQAVWPPEEWLRRAGSVVRPGGCVYVLSSAPLPPDALPPDSLLEEERRYQGRTLERWTARVRLKQ